MFNEHQHKTQPCVLAPEPAPAPAYSACRSRATHAQDTILWWPLAKTMIGMFTTDPVAVLRSMPQVRCRLARWLC